ncbi:MAG: hypothetical protein M3Q68_06355, partial [Actinomycetota bacterium]|nr:hypothetical protein [Actinomycetota bacterium]
MTTQRLGFFSKFGTPIAVVASLAMLLALAPSKSPERTNEFADASTAPGATVPTGDDGTAAASTTADGELAATSAGSVDPVTGATTVATVLGTQSSRTVAGGATTRTGGTAAGGTATGAAPAAGAGGAAAVAAPAAAEAPRFGGTSAATAGADCTRSEIFKSADFGCKPAWSGNNGGTTYAKGISGDKVQAVFYVGNTGATLAEEPAQAATVCGIPNPTPEQFDKTILTFNKFLNKHYQTYGRAVDYKVFRAQALSTDSAATRAEAVKVDQEIKPFLLVNSFANEFVDETSRRGIVNFGGVGLSGAFLKSHAPFVFQLGHDTDTGNQLLAEWIGNRVNPYPTKITGADSQAPNFSPPRGV